MCSSMMFSKFSLLFNHHHKLVLEYFHPSNKSLYPFTVNPVSSFILRRTLLYFLSLWICLFWEFCRNEIIQHIVFHVGLLSLSIVLIHAIACIIICFFLLPNGILSEGYTTFCLSIHHLLCIWIVEDGY